MNPVAVHGGSSLRSSYIQLEATITFANYTDWDNDLFEDDIYFYLALNFTDVVVPETAVIETTVYIELPSGTIISGAVRYSVYTVDQVITIYSLDTATEAGWYTVTTVTALLGSGKSDVSVSQYLFDPPTGKGNGLPS